jgi:hypothetical protein
MQKTFAASAIQKIIISDVKDDLEVRGWEQASIEVNTDEEPLVLVAEEGTLTIQGCAEKLTLNIPFETAIQARSIHASVELTNIDYAEIGNVGDSLVVEDISTLNVKRVGNTCKLGGRRETIVTLGSVGDSLYAQNVGKLTVNHVGDHCQVTTSPHAYIQLGRVGGNLVIDGAGRLSLGKIGGKSQLRNVQGDVELGSTGSELKLTEVAGNVQVGKVGGNASIQAIQGTTTLGRVGGNLSLQTTFPVDSVSRFSVGGNTTIELPVDANLTIQAATGGSVQGQGIKNIQGKHTLLIYGEGAAHVEVSTGGNLQLNGDTAPRSIDNGRSGANADNSYGWNKENWKDYKDSWKNYKDSWRDWRNYDWENFEGEMKEFGHEMSDLGQEIAQKVTSAVNEAIAAIKIEPDSEGAAARQANRGQRIFVRVNDREWRMDQERVNRIVEQAQRAATEGIQGAQEAVSQALRNLNYHQSRRCHPLHQQLPPLLLHQQSLSLHSLHPLKDERRSRSRQ